DWRLIGVAFVVTLVTAALCGLIPAWRLTRPEAVADLRTRVIGARSPRFTLGRALIAVQIAITVPLLVGAVLFLRTLHNMAGVGLGFEPKGLHLMTITLPPEPQPAGQAPKALSPGRARVLRDILVRIESVPGVESATLVENVLASGTRSNTT